MITLGAYIGTGCDASSSDFTTGALEGNSSSESSSSKSSSRLTLDFSAAGGVGASSMATSSVSGSVLNASACEAVPEDSSADIASGVTECGIASVINGALLGGRMMLRWRESRKVGKGSRVAR